MIPIRLGTRGSRLALAQAHAVAASLEKTHGWEPGTVEIVPITTTGDMVQDRPLADIGGKALWTKELDRALAAGTIDASAHSMKDVESDRPPEFLLAAMLERADVRDRLVGAGSIEALDEGATVGTCSPRRSAQLRRLRPDLRIALLRGNVETRLRKVADGEVDATLLAAAGLDRLGITAGSAIECATILPAPGQGAIGIECRANDERVAAALRAITHRDTADCVAAERSFTKALGGTCASPVAALGRADGDGIALIVQVLSADGRHMVERKARFARGELAGPAALARVMLDGAPAAIRALFAAA